MTIRIHPHARERMIERGATEEEVLETLRHGERVPARQGRTKFERAFPCGREWQGRTYPMKRIEAIAAQEREGWLVVTIVVKYF